jgi:hypothetical protein
MEAVELLGRLHAAGFSLTAEGERLMVAPSTSLTDEIRAQIRGNKPGLMALLAGRSRPLAEATADRLRAAINRACLERGDSEGNRQTLLDEALAQPIEMQIDLAEHFEQVAAIWQAAKLGKLMTSGRRPSSAN